MSSRNNSTAISSASVSNLDKSELKTLKVRIRRPNVPNSEPTGPLLRTFEQGDQLVIQRERDEGCRPIFNLLSYIKKSEIKSLQRVIRRPNLPTPHSNGPIERSFDGGPLGVHYRDDEGRRPLLEHLRRNKRSPPEEHHQREERVIVREKSRTSSSDERTSRSRSRSRSRVRRHRRPSYHRSPPSSSQSAPKRHRSPPTTTTRSNKDRDKDKKDATDNRDRYSRAHHSQRRPSRSPPPKAPRERERRRTRSRSPPSTRSRGTRYGSRSPPPTHRSRTNRDTRPSSPPQRRHRSRDRTNSPTGRAVPPPHYPGVFHPPPAYAYYEGAKGEFWPRPIQPAFYPPSGPFMAPPVPFGPRIPMPGIRPMIPPQRLPVYNNRRIVTPKVGESGSSGGASTSTGEPSTSAGGDEVVVQKQGGNVKGEEDKNGTAS